MGVGNGAVFFASESDKVLQCYSSKSVSIVPVVEVKCAGSTNAKM